MTSSPSYTVIDLGTKKGASLDGFRTLGQGYQFDEIPPSQCLGVDIREDLAGEVRAKGYHYLPASALGPRDLPDDVVSKLWPEGLSRPPYVFDYPPADFYLANHFLEHLPSVGHSQLVLSKMCRAARRGLWLVLPSFETGGPETESALRKFGLRFTWTRWHGHPSHFLVEHALETLRHELRNRSPRIKIVKSAPMTTTHDHRVVPIDAPIDTLVYEPSLGPRPKRRLDPPVIGEYEIRVRMDPP